MLKEQRSVGEKRNIAVNHSVGEIVMHWDDDDIYGGLDAAASSAETAGLREQLAAAEAERDALRADAGAATAESARLREANETLERNISVLFNTAKAEIARKDREIARLQGAAGT